MVKSCAVRGCRNSSRQKRGVKFHRFPTLKEDCKLWIQRCGLSDDTEFHTLVNKRVCSAHFQTSDYLPDLITLIPAAYPSINIPGEALDPNHILTIRTDARQNNYTVRLTNSIVLSIRVEIDQHCSDGVYTYNVVTNEPNVTEPVNSQLMNEQSKKQLEQSIRGLKSRNKILRTQLKSSRNLKGSASKGRQVFKSLVKKTVAENRAVSKQRKSLFDSKMKSSKDKLTRRIEKLEGGLARIFSKKQVDVLLNNKQRPKWTNRDIGSAIPLRYKANAYEHLRSQGFPLPSSRTIRRYTSKIDFSPGTIFPVINLLQQQFKNASEKDRICVISFDEMSIDSSIAYDPDEDRLYGPKANINGYFVRGLFSNWKQLIAYDLDDDMKPEKYLDIVSVLEHAGFQVAANVNDLGGKNRGLMSKLGIRVKKVQEDDRISYDVASWTTNPVSGKKIYFFADIPHLIKLLRNNLLIHGLTIKGGYRIEKKDYEHLLKVDHAEFKANWKLSSYHLNVQGREKMRVRPAVQMFSKTVAEVWKLAYPNRTAAATFIQLVNDFFDVMNSRTPDEKLPSKQPFGSNVDYQMNILEAMEDAIINLKVGTSKALYPFQRGILISIHSMRGLFIDYVVNSSLRITYILTHRLNQDFVENAFSIIRQMGAYNDHPSPVDAKRRLKLLMLSWSGIASKSSAVENEDNRGFISGSMIQWLTDPINDESCKDPVQINLSPDPLIIDELSESNVEEVITSMGLVQRCEESGKEYVSGFVASKFGNKYPNLVASVEELLAVGDLSWVKSLSSGGLTVPSLAWRNMCQILYSEFKDFHRYSPNDLNRCLGVLKGFCNSLVQKYPEIPEEPLRKYVQTVLHIRIKNVNKKLKEEKIEKRKIITARIAARARKSAIQEEVRDEDYDSEEDPSSVENRTVEEEGSSDAIMSDYNPNQVINSYEAFLTEENE